MDKSKYSEENMSSDNVVLAFDLYGTLLDTGSIADKLSEYFGEKQGPELAAKWRLYQIQYTWRLNSMEQYEPFSEVTRRALLHTLKEASIALDDKQVENLTVAYDSLAAFPDAAPVLTALSSATGITPVIFSNGTQSMVSNCIKNSADLSQHAHIFKDVITVETPQRYKPARAVYEHLAAKVGKGKGEMDQIWLVSGNPFDVNGARAAGMKVAWVDRGGAGWVDQLGLEPTVALKSLEELLEAVKSNTSG